MSCPLQRVRPWAIACLTSIAVGSMVNCGSKASNVRGNSRPCKSAETTGTNTSTQKATSRKTGTKTGTSVKSASNLLGESLADATKVAASDGDSSLALADEPPTWDDVIKPLFNKHCTGCHSPAGATQPELDTYEKAKKNAQRSVETMQGTRPTMPPSQLLPDSEVAKVVAWQKGNFLRSAGDGGTPPAKGTAKAANGSPAPKSNAPKTDDVCKSGNAVGTSTGTRGSLVKTPTSTRTSTATSTVRSARP